MDVNLKLKNYYREKYKKYIPTIAKYLFSVIITFLAFKTSEDVKYLLVGLAELAIIIIVSNLLLNKKRWLGLCFNDLFSLLYNIQMLVLFFGNSYVMLVMLENLGSIEALSGKAFEYGAGVVLLLFFSFIPIQRLEVTKLNLNLTKYLTVILAVDLCLTLFWGNTFSPVFAYCILGEQKYDQVKQQQLIDSESENLTQFFYRDGISDDRKKNENLTDTPNVILIFAEGLSSNIAYDDRNIMPNLSELMDKSMNFTGYYNHTFATYRGIIGQLYSGYQNNNTDINTLISIQDIFRNNNYKTSFINTEPNNAQFTQYLYTLDFDEIVGDTEMECNGMANSISDEDAFDLLFDTALEREKEGSPFFLSMYSFGTHASLDSTGEKFGDGNDRMLNKFYNLDVQLGKFIENFENSELFDNTVLIFTTDHATFADNDFKNAFPDYERTFVEADEIPLLIYHKGVEAGSIEAEGRNTLDLAPTILDYLDISAPNYFLGNSLFASKQNSNVYETVFSYSDALYDTDNGNLTLFSEDKKDIVQPLIQKYFIAKQQEAVK